MQGHTMKRNIKQHVVVLSKEVTISVNVGYHQNLMYITEALSPHIHHSQKII